MGVIKSLWASVQGDPVFMRRLNGWLTICWLVMIPVSYSVGWLQSVTYVSALSLWALVSGHWSAWQAARVEVAQDKQVRELEEHPLEDRVVEKLVDETQLEPSAKPHVGRATAAVPAHDRGRDSRTAGWSSVPGH
jgi:hypothetical protein